MLSILNRRVRINTLKRNARQTLKYEQSRGKVMSEWRSALQLDSQRNVINGSAHEFRAAIDRAADLRIYTEFRHNEHIDVGSSNPELIREVAEFGVTYSIDHRWAAGIMHLRQPIELPIGFGTRPSMSFFVYNEDGAQGIARPYLDGKISEGSLGSSPISPPDKMPKYHAFDNWDEQTNAPSHNFVYDFETFRYCVNDSWREVLHHSSTGEVLSGSLSELVDAFSAGCAMKLGLENLCQDLQGESATKLHHTVYVQGGSAYYYTEQKLLIIGTHPVIRVRPQIPLQYASGNWDFGWVMVRSDGRVVYRRCDPYTLKFTDHVQHNSVRWFVR